MTPNTTETESFCRCCMAMCGIIVRTRGDEVLEVRGDRDHPVSSGYCCAKGRSLPAIHHDERRLSSPELRGNSGAMVAAGWDAALGDLGQRLKTLIAEDGPDAIGSYHGTGAIFDAAGHRAGARFLRSIGSRQRYTSVTVDTPCKPLVQELVAGRAGLMPLLDVDAARFALVVGTNPVVSHGHSNPFPDPVRRLREIATRGELWVIDPRHTETAALATRHLAPLPGTDAFLLATVLRAYLASPGPSTMAATGLEALSAAVSPFTPALAASQCGLPLDDVEALVAAVRRSGGANVVTGTGISMGADANVVEWLGWCLNIVTGAMDRPGGMWFNPGFLASLDRRPWAPAHGTPEPGPPSRPDLHDRFGERPVSGLIDEIGSGRLRALVVAGGAPLTAFPDADRTATALAALDVLVVVDVARSALADRATHILPATGQLERADLPGSIDLQLPAVYSQHTPALVAPAPGRRPMWWIYRQLEARLGGQPVADTRTDDDELADLARHARVPYADLVAARGAVVDSGPVFGWLATSLPAGGFRLAPPELLAQLRSITADDARPSTSPRPTPAATSVVDVALVAHRSRGRLNAVEVPGRVAAPTIDVHPADAAAIQVTDGDDVLLTSAAGSLIGVARTDRRLRPGTVALVHGVAALNVATFTSGRPGDVDALTGMVRQTALPLQLRRP